MSRRQVRALTSDDRPVLFLIPARGGSRRIPGKNLRTVAGIPLVAHAIRLATATARSIPGGPHRVVCSTDDPEIGRVASAWGAEVPFRRPDNLARADATSVDVALDAIERLEATGPAFRALVMIQPTSPITDPADLRAAIAHFDTNNRDVVAATDSHPLNWHLAEGSDGVAQELGTVPSNQVASPLLSGAFYVIAPDRLRAARRFVQPGLTFIYRVPEERSVDVDEEGDLVVAEALAASRPIRRMKIAAFQIGGGRSFLIAEAGVNHNGDPDMAHRLVDAAADSGADAVKFQTFDPNRLAAPGAPTADYQRMQTSVAIDQRALLARLALPNESWSGLQSHAGERGLVFLSSPFDEPSADLLERLEVPAFKVGSGELTNLPFLAFLARKGRPLLVSTGMADMIEVAQAVDAIAGSRDVPVALLHCVSVYPAEAADANLRAIATLRSAFLVPAGWSDHSPGVELSIAAAALGADIIEKHITLDRRLPGPDHHASLDPGSFRDMVASVRSVEAGLGNGRKEPVASEEEIAVVARRSLHWSADLAAGERITAADVEILRPGTGIKPSHLADIVGRRTRQSVHAGVAVKPDDIESWSVDSGTRH
jgi:N,N'-diacetyllegionaminate synthase